MSEPEPGPAPGPEPTGPDPAVRIRPGAAGIPVELAGGRTWLLAHGGVAAGLAPLRDRIYDAMALQGAVSIVDAIAAAWPLLAANYSLAPAELAALLTGADEEALVNAVADALFGPEAPAQSYSEWALTSLHGAGLDPAAIPNALVPAVLEALERTGRARPRGDVIGSLREAERQRRWDEQGDKWRALAARDPSPAPPPGPPAPP